MSSLHKAVYQIALNPQLLRNIDQDTQPFMDKFNLSHYEVAALKSVLSNHKTWQHLLSSETLKRAVQNSGVEVWIPAGSDR